MEEVLSPTSDVLQNGKGGMYLPCSPSELSLSTFKNPSSFEELTIRPHDPLTYITLSFYQLPGHSPSFMDDFSTQIAEAFSATVPAIIVGDSNIHKDDPFHTLAS